MPQVLNRLRSGIPEGAVYIGRPSKWGNPFKVGKHGTRDQCVERYAAWIAIQPGLRMALPELTGKDLVCWCAPQRCHGDVLLALANPPEEAGGR